MIGDMQREPVRLYDLWYGREPTASQSPEHRANMHSLRKPPRESLPPHAEVREKRYVA